MSTLLINRYWDWDTCYYKRHARRNVAEAVDCNLDDLWFSRWVDSYLDDPWFIQWTLTWTTHDLVDGFSPGRPVIHSMDYDLDGPWFSWWTLSWTTCGSVDGLWPGWPMIQLMDSHPEYPWFSQWTLTWFSLWTIQYNAIQYKNLQCAICNIQCYS